MTSHVCPNHVSITLPPLLRERLDTYAAQMRCPQEEVIRAALTDYLDQNTYPNQQGQPSALIALNQLNLTIRSYSRLRDAGVEYLNELEQWSATELLALPGFGKGSLNEIREYLAEHGLALKPGDPVTQPARVKPACAEVGCDRPARARGLCITHYCRQRQLAIKQRERNAGAG